jgi:thiamine biosynthesis protein ThiI
MKAVTLLSGGIDSPVALYVMAKRMECNALFMDTGPFMEEPPGKIPVLVRQVERATDAMIPLYRAPFGRLVQWEIRRQATPRFRCLLCKRMMYRVAERLAAEVDADVLVTGENLGQVASQTLSNLVVLDDAVSLPIIRPLIGLDKQEIIEIAKRIGTYEHSIAGNASCTLVPRQPATASKLPAVQDEETKLDVSGLVEAALEQLVQEKL